MNVALFAYHGEVDGVMRNCIRSLRACSACRIEIHGKFPRESDLNIPIIALDEALWTGRRITRRMELAALAGQPDDQVMVFDTDLYFKDDPFEVFNQPFDFFYTTRPSPNPLSPVNGGVWGFRVTDASRALLEFMVEQARHPTWEPYLAVRSRLRRTDRQRELDWWTHQDLLCALHEAGPPVPCRLHDAGPLYNWCPDTGPERPLTPEAIRKFKAGFNDPSVVVLHYKELQRQLEVLE